MSSLRWAFCNPRFCFHFSCKSERVVEDHQKQYDSKPGRLYVQLCLRGVTVGIFPWQVPEGKSSCSVKSSESSERGKVNLIRINLLRVAFTVGNRMAINSYIQPCQAFLVPILTTGTKNSLVNVREQRNLWRINFRQTIRWMRPDINSQAYIWQEESTRSLWRGNIVG